MPKKSVKKNKNEKKGETFKRDNIEKIIIFVVFVGVVIILFNFFLNSFYSKGVDDSLDVSKKVDKDLISGNYELRRWEHSGLRDALKYEYLSFSTYEKAISVLGDDEPFVRVLAEKSRNLDDLKTFLEVYGLDVPQNIWEDKIVLSSKKSEICFVARQREEKLVNYYNAALRTAENPDYIKLFQRLKKNAQDATVLFRQCE